MINKYEKKLRENIPTSSFFINISLETILRVYVLYTYMFKEKLIEVLTFINW